AEFRIFLPRATGSQAQPVGKDDQAGSSPRGAETILLVEDEDTVRNFTRKILEMKGYSVLEANNGDNALLVDEQHKDIAIHLLVTDMIMPGMGGRELAQRFLLSRPETRVLFMS